MSKAIKVKEIQKKLWVNRGLKMTIKELTSLLETKKGDKQMEKNVISRELSQEEVEEAKKTGYCPFCKDECKSFWATVTAIQEFSLEDKDGIEWGDTEGLDNVNSVECRECGEDIPKEIWLVWFKREQV